jgi:thiamine biosynthesis lipoprotein
VLATPRGFVRREFRAMGTTVTIVLPASAAAAATGVEALFATWETTLSRFRPESELSQLNASAGRTVSISPLLLLVVEAALRAARATDGIFDPTLQPHLAALGYDRTFDDVAPDGPPPAPLGPGGSWRSIVVDRAAGTVRLPAGAGLDLGGIAKGMAVDEAVTVLRGHGVATAVVEAGGDLAVTGLPPGAPAWPVAVEVVGGRREISIACGGLATSGISRRSWRRGGVDQHHLVDPRTGGSARNDLWSVTAAAASCAQAEVAAKVAFVLGRAEAARFLSRLGISALLVGRDGGEELVGPWAGRSTPASFSEPLVASRGLA